MKQILLMQTIENLTKVIVIFMLIYYLVMGLFSSIGMFIYFKKRQTPKPGLVFIPYYKHFYFEKYSFGIAISRRIYNPPPYILGTLNIFMIVSLLCFGTKVFTVFLMLYMCYRGYVFRAMYKHYEFKYLFSIIILTIFGGAPIMLIFLAHSYVPEYDLNIKKDKNIRKYSKYKST